MPVYVDDMRAKYGRMIMCHMFADSTEELVNMARTIGVNPKWIQHPGTVREHFDVCLSAKKKALTAGAIQITQMDAGKLLQMRRDNRPQDFALWLKGEIPE